MPEEVFINCVPDDIQVAEEIEKRLGLAGISFYTAPASVNPVIQKEMVEKIQRIAAAHGCMVCLSSQKAVTNSLFIGNIQLMCETARNNRVLVKYQMEGLENDQSTRLFDSQAYQVRRTGNPSEDISRIVKRINQIIHPPARNVFQMLPGIISRKTLSWLMLAVVILAVAASVFFNSFHKEPPAPALPTPTPVLIFVPYSGQSQNAGLRVDAQTVPENKPTTAPAVEAPFAFTPNHIFEKDDFNNPAFDHSFDGLKWMNNYNRLESAPGVVLSQANGVLQMAVAPTGDEQGYLTLNSKYMFNPQQVTYVGFRFRLNDYLGRIQENSFINWSFSYQFVDIPDLFNIQVNGSSQKLQLNNSEISLGSHWHTIEMVSLKDRHFAGIYLDGKWVRTISFDETQFDRWMHATFAMYVSKTSDWASMQIDEVVIGGDDPITPTMLPEEAAYRFTPDQVSLHEDFNTPLPQSVLASGSPFVTQSGGVLSFRIPAGKDSRGFDLLFPTRPINQDNYYALRFRFTSPDDDYWAAAEQLFLGVVNRDQYQKSEYKYQYDLNISAFRHEYRFTGSHTGNGRLGGFPFRQNTGLGNWHTLEMVIKPPEGLSETYTAFFWADGYLLGKGSLMQNPASLLDSNAPLAALIQVYSPGYQQENFSGDFEDLVIGTIASEKIKE